MRHELTKKRFLYNKVKHRFVKQNKCAAQIAEELNEYPEKISRICDNVFFSFYHLIGD